MGVVYRAFDSGLNRNVALKLLAPELARDERFRRRFLAESQLAAALEHPHAVPVYDAGEANGQLYIVMRYVEGTDLKALLAVEAPLVAARAVEICSQVAEALDSAHARGLVHRDVKPSNVLLDEGERVYLADFGLTRRLGDVGADSSVGLSLGTPAYVAPEQIEGKDLDGRADQYSLGCLLFECLSGRAPFARASEAAVLFAHLEERPPSLPGLEDVFETALAKAPGDRFPSCRDLIEAARDALGIVEPRRGRWPFVVAGVGAAVLGGALLAFALDRSGSGALPRVQGNAIAMIDPGSDRVMRQVSVGARPASIAFGSGSLWVANLDDQTVSRLDPHSGRVLHVLPVDGTPTGLATSRDAVWVVLADPNRPAVTVRRIDPRFNLVVDSLRLPNVVAGGAGSVAASGDAVWVAPSSGLLTKLDAAKGRVVNRLDPQAGPAGVAVGDGAVWVTDYFANTVTEVDSAGRRRVVDVAGGPTGVAYGDGAVWVADSLSDSVSRVDPRSRRVLARIEVGGRPASVAVGAGAVWVANSQDGTVSRIDPSTDRVTGRIDIGGSPQAITVAGGRVWVTVQPAIGGASSVAPAGGTANLNAKGDGFANGINPAYWQIQYATCADLVNYPDAPAPAGSRMVPELAAAMPTPSPDGRTYTFTIRKGFRFSPPSNQPVTAETVAYTLERNLSPKVSAGDTGLLANVVGAQAYATGKASRLRGVHARGDRLTIRLVAPDPALLWRLQYTTCVVPVGTPFDPRLGLLDLPAAGPYYVASQVPGQGVVLVRNPNYRGNRPHRLDRIKLTLGVSPQRTVAEVQAGTVDFAADGVPLSDATRLAARYGPGSPAARRERQQYFVDPKPEVDFLVLNTQRRLFASARLRRAVNYAIDRRALLRLGGPFLPVSLRATEAYLPPGMPGFRGVHIYPFTPDLAAARRLAGRGKRIAVMYTCNDAQCLQIARVVKANLKAIGIDVRVRAINGNEYFQRVFAKGAPYDIALMGWLADGLDPWDFLNQLLEGRILPTLQDPAYRGRLAAAERLSGPRRYLAYETLDSELTRNAAPWVAYGNAVDHDFFSSRIGCQIYQPIEGIDLAALCIRKR